MSLNSWPKNAFDEHSGIAQIFKIASPLSAEGEQNAFAKLN